MISESSVEKIKKIMANFVSKEGRDFSFSGALNMILREGFIAFEKNAKIKIEDLNRDKKEFEEAFDNAMKERKITPEDINNFTLEQQKQIEHILIRMENQVKNLTERNKIIDEEEKKNKVEEKKKDE